VPLLQFHQLRIVQPQSAQGARARRRREALRVLWLAELLAQALALGPAGVSGLPGSTVEKAIGGRRYLYHQVVEPGGRRRQWYIGPADDARTATLLERVATARADAETDRVRLDELRAAFLAAGGQPLAPAAMRILKAFGDAGVLRPGPDGAVLVGTWAFLALANPLGVRWAGGLTTQDIDFAAAPATIGLAIEHPERPAPDVLQSLDLGFVPMPTQKWTLQFGQHSIEIKVEQDLLSAGLMARHQATAARPA
jgi:hypothetical protein